MTSQTTQNNAKRWQQAKGRGYRCSCAKLAAKRMIDSDQNCYHYQEEEAGPEVEVE